ncbi:NADH-quinone oxidoreductase subunit NuoE [Serinibacter arcticus]|uniref:NADH-quinone oxidoreductase subunit NuoE n=1 Tax=Serinibacter arcticus TaxID=1655435 RepID=A0A2U1ZU93_9MICO|nr:NADH-quinone oxidoreductase subunit NuoE [Serinibacter arcticus]PWD50541.1 NADH-quinone oxidoreductase subunit NuoE [Serinibacter arcticus]
MTTESVTSAGAGRGPAVIGTPAAAGSLYPKEVAARLREDAAAVVARYPEPRSALLPLLHLIQSVDSFVSPRGVAFCAETLGLSRAEVSAVATFYSQYKRKPNGAYTVGVCTNTLCAVMGGDDVFATVSAHLGIGNDETTDDGQVTLERLECNAACDYAPVVMVNWEFFDNATPASAVDLVDRLRAGERVEASRGPVVQDFKAVSRVLAGFEDGLVDDGPSAGEATLVGLRISREHDWHAPAYPEAEHDGESDVAEDGTGRGEVGEEQSSSEHAEPTPHEATTGERPDEPADQAGTEPTSPKSGTEGTKE